MYRSLVLLYHSQCRIEMNNIYFTQFTQKNTIWKDKPNEDYILIDEIKKIYIIFIVLFFFL